MFPLSVGRDILVDMFGGCNMITWLAISFADCTNVLLGEDFLLLFPPCITGPRPRNPLGSVAGGGNVAGAGGGCGGAVGSVTINRSIGDGGDGHTCFGGLIWLTVVMLGVCIKVGCCFTWLLLYMSVNCSRCSSCEVAIVGIPSALLMVAMSCWVASAM